MPSARRFATAALATALGLGLLAACSDDSSDQTVSTTSRTAATTTTASTAPSTEGCPPAVSATVTAVCYSSGTAHVEVSGDASQTFDAPLKQTPAIARFPGDMILSYAAPSGAAVLVVVKATAGTFPSQLPWAIRLVTVPTKAWDAALGQCSITVTTATQQKIDGSFSCHKVPESKETGKAKATVNATGTFSAAA